MSIDRVTWDASAGVWKYQRKVPPRFRKALDGISQFVVRLWEAPRLNTSQGRLAAFDASTAIRREHDRLFAHLASLTPDELAAFKYSEAAEQARQLSRLELRARHLAEDSATARALKERYAKLNPNLRAILPYPQFVARIAEEREHVTDEIEAAKASAALMPAGDYAITALIDIWRERKRDARIPHKTLANLTRAVEAFAEWCATKSVRDYRLVTADHALDWTAALAQETNAKGKPRSFEDQISRIRLVSAVFSAACALRKIKSGNPFENAVPATQAPAARSNETKIYTAAQMRALRDAQQKTNWFGEQGRWCLLLAMYTMARQGEIGALLKSDVAMEGKSVVLHFRGDAAANKSVKTSASERRVPVHKDIAKAFWRFVQASKTERLFPLLEPKGKDKFDWGRRLSNDFAPLRKAAGVPSHLTFRHFRSTGTTLLSLTDVPERRQDYLSGHSRGRDVKSKHYLAFRSIADLQDAMDRINPFKEPA